uniref:P2X purinoreceptor 7 intracellular domain-containing protein n=1 Tax=Sander lucioperca TaxID=283035 RepID=A0A8D0DBT7_SANLU
MDADDAHRLVTRVMDREHGLIFDVLQPAAQGAEAPLQGVTKWCSCSRCREMGTDIENKCCGMMEATCISRLPHMSLDEHVLRLARRLRNDIYALHDTQLPGDDNREYRYAAYKNFVLWQYGALGVGNRVVIPSRCVSRIQDKYPDPIGRYTGFIEAVL